MLTVPSFLRLQHPFAQDEQHSTEVQTPQEVKTRDRYLVAKQSV